MAKIIALFIILVLLAIVQVSGFRTTTITTTTIVAEEIKEQSKCKQEIKKLEKELMQCQLYLQQQGGGQEEKEEQEHLRQCCNRLELFNAECRCEAIQHIVGRVQGGEGEQMVEKARQLPQRCNMEEPKECPMIIRSPEMAYYISS